MDRKTLRIILTILMYAGIVICILPHVSGRAAAASLFLLTGALIAVICGILRCCLTEEEF